MRKRSVSALALVALLSGIGCKGVTVEEKPSLDLEPFAAAFDAPYLVNVTSVASGPEGDVLIGGTFNGTVDFGGGSLFSGDGYHSVFIAHLDEEGNHLFSGSTGANDSLSAAAVGPGGELYVAGNYDGAINFGSGKLTGYKNGYLGAFQPGGASDFSLALGGEAEDWVDDMTVTPSGDLIVVGRAGNDADFGGGAPSDEFSSKDAVIAAYDRSGEHRWEVRIPNALNIPLSVAADGGGNVVVAGMSYQDIELGAFKTGGGAFIAKISPFGTPLWLTTSTSQSGDAPYIVDLAAGPDGSVFASGVYYYGDISFGGAEFEITPEGRSFWLRLSPSGGSGEGHFYSMIYYDDSPRLAVAPNGDVVMGMTSYSAVDFGGGLVGTGPGQNVVLARFTPEGQHLRSMELEGDSDEGIRDVAVDPDGNALVTGWFATSVEIGDQKLETLLGHAAFVARLDF